MFIASNTWGVNGTAISRVCASVAGSNNNSQCIGYLIAMHEMAVAQKKVCFPKLSKTIQRPETNKMRHRKMVNAVVTYYANNPKVKNEQAPKHIIAAFAALWPCNVMTEQMGAERKQVFPL